MCGHAGVAQILGMSVLCVFVFPCVRVLVFCCVLSADCRRLGFPGAFPAQLSLAVRAFTGDVVCMQTVE